MRSKSAPRLTLVTLFGVAAAVGGYFLSVNRDGTFAFSHPEPKRNFNADLAGQMVPWIQTAAPSHHAPFALVPGSPFLTAFPSLEPENPSTLDEIERLKLSNEIINLADRVIISGNLSDFQKLEKLGLQLKDPLLIQTFELQILRVDRFFYSRRGHRSFPIDVPKYYPEKKTEDDLTVGELVHLLIDPSQPRDVRVRAADLLGKLPPGSQPPLPGYLLRAAETDPSLDVIDEALQSFGKLTNTYPNRLFDTVPASVWWQYNKPK